MVIYVTSSDPRFIIYLGKDKYENESLIKYGFPIDVWFHVEGYSSAHVYLRLPDGITINNIPSNILEECCQIVRDGSKEGRKQESVKICYTKWENLRKGKNMEIGEIGFKNDKEIHYINNVKKNKELLNKLKKTWIEKQIDYEKEKEMYLLEEKNKRKKEEEIAKKKELEEIKKNKEIQKEKRFEYIDELGKEITNKDDVDLEEDFW
jgi:hypothetical protein